MELTIHGQNQLFSKKNIDGYGHLEKAESPCISGRIAMSIDRSQTGGKSV